MTSCLKIPIGKNFVINNKNFKTMITLFKDPFFNTFDKVFSDVNTYKQTNIERNETDYRVQISVPGLTKLDIKLSVKEGLMSILYEKPEENGPIFTDSFRKTYTLPDDVEEKNITGTVENGVLEITLPKSKKKTTERLISLN